MTDPGMLPSAIMQVTGTLLGIFVVVYVLARPLLSRGATHYLEMNMDQAFLIMGVLSVITIVLNLFWLDSLSANLYVNFCEETNLQLGRMAGFFLSLH